MKKALSLILLFLFLLSVYAEDLSSFDQLIEYETVEKIGDLFCSKNSEYDFEKKFSLSQEELELVGSWVDNWFSEDIKQNGKKVKILLPDFYPNRILKVSVDCFTKEYPGTRLILFFCWRMNEYQLELKPLYFILRDGGSYPDPIIKSGFIDTETFHWAGNINYYKNYYILTDQLDFSFLNSLSFIQSIIWGKDNLRYRLMHGYAMKSDYEKIEENSQLQTYLYNADFSDEKFFLNFESNFAEDYLYNNGK